MASSFCLLLVSIVVSRSSADQPSIPSLPNFISGFTETITNVNGSKISVDVSWSSYDANMKLSRVDVAGETLNVSGDLGNQQGTISFIEDTTVGVLYAINRHYSNCFVSNLNRQASTSGNGIIRSVKDLLLLSELEVDYDYTGNTSAHGVVLDTWVFSGSVQHGGYNYTSSLLQWSITQPGQAVSSTITTTTSRIPWRLSINGLVTPGGTAGATSTNISSVTRYFDLSFDEPDLDVFDTSICVEPMDAIFLTLAFPVTENGTDLSSFKGDIRKVVSRYAEIYPIQVGNVEIVSRNRTFIFVSLQISNLTSVSNVTDRKTALNAYTAIMENTVEGRAPFTIEIHGVEVTPYVLTPNTTSCQGDDVSTPFITISSSEPSPSESALTSTPVVTTTVTVTETASSCSQFPTPTPSMCPPYTPSPVGVANSRVVGIAFGTLFTGAFIACISMVVCFFCYQKTRTRTWSPSTAGYQKQPDTAPERDYFQ